MVNRYTRRFKRTNIILWLPPYPLSGKALLSVYCKQSSRVPIRRGFSYMPRTRTVILLCRSKPICTIHTIWSVRNCPQSVQLCRLHTRRSATLATQLIPSISIITITFRDDIHSRKSIRRTMAAVSMVLKNNFHFLWWGILTCRSLQRGLQALSSSSRRRMTLCSSISKRRKI